MNQNTSPDFRPVFLILTWLLAGPANAQNTVTWDGTCLAHPTAASNLWNARCLFPPDLDDFTNWNNERFPEQTDHVVIPAGIPGGVRIFDSFSSFSATINSASPLLIDGGGPVFMLDPAGVSNMVDLTLANGQLTVAHQLVLSGTSSMAEGIFTDNFGDADGGHLIITDNFTVTGLAPNPFARTALFIKRVENLGTVNFSGSVSSDTDSIVDNRGIWSFVDASTYGSNTADFVNHPDSTLNFDVATPGGTVFLASKLHNDQGTINHSRGTLVLTAEGNVINHRSRGSWAMGPGTRISLDSGFPNFGIPAATLEWQGDTLDGPAGGGTTLEVKENATLKLPNGTNRTLHGVSLVNHGTVEHGTDNNTSSSDRLQITAGASFTNASTGTYDLAGEFGRGTLIIDGQATNEGKVLLNGSIKVAGAPPFLNEGTIEIRDLRGATIAGSSRLGSTMENRGILRDGPGSRQLELKSITILNEGTINLSSPLQLADAIVRQSAGEWTASQSIESQSFDHDSAVEIRDGSLRVDSESNFHLQPRFDVLGGTVELGAPAVILSGGGSSSGAASFTLDEETVCYFTGPPHHFDGDYLFSGEGELHFGMTHEERQRLRPGRPGTGDIFVDGGTLTIDVGGERIFATQDRYFVNRSTLTVAENATLAVQSPSNFVNDRTLDLHGSITMPTGSTIINGNPSSSSHSRSRIRIFSKPGATNQLPHTVDNPGSCEVSAEENSTAILSGDVIQADKPAGSLRGGSWIARNAASLDIQNMTLASIEPSTRIELSGTGRFLPLERSDNFVNNGSVNLESAAALTHGGFWENNGRLSIPSGCSLTVTSQFETNEHSNIRVGGTLNVDDFDNDGGRFSGSGTINAQSFNNDGELSPGSSPGTLTINSPFTQSSTGTLNIEINGTEPGTTHDQLVISGSATLAGTLAVCLAPSFHPTPGQTFTILSAASVSGTFSRIDIGATGNRTTFTATYANGEVTLTAAATTYPNYATWRTAKFDPVAAADPLISAQDADPDADGIPNGLEYAAALRPTKRDIPPFSYQIDPAAPRSVDALIPFSPDTTGVTPTFQSSTDLTTWSPVAATLTETRPPVGLSLPVRVYRITLPPGSTGYTRLSGIE